MDESATTTTNTADDQAGLLAAGWIGMLVFPIAGVVIGLVLANRKPQTGLLMAGLSLASGFVWLTLLSN
jgi:uncharacterized membrane protein HdeD (DUF308 family)